MITLEQYRDYLQRFGDDATQIIEDKEFAIDQLKLALKMCQQRIDFLERLFDMRNASEKKCY